MEAWYCDEYIYQFFPLYIRQSGNIFMSNVYTLILRLYPMVLIKVISYRQEHFKALHSFDRRAEHACVITKCIESPLSSHVNPGDTRRPCSGIIPGSNCHGGYGSALAMQHPRCQCWTVSGVVMCDRVGCVREAWWRLVLFLYGVGVTDTHYRALTFVP